jgi:hypothetical protein
MNASHPLYILIHDAVPTALTDIINYLVRTTKKYCVYTHNYSDPENAVTQSQEVISQAERSFYNNSTNDPVTSSASSFPLPPRVNSISPKLLNNIDRKAFIYAVGSNGLLSGYSIFIILTQSHHRVGLSTS